MLVPIVHAKSSSELACGDTRPAPPAGEAAPAGELASEWGGLDSKTGGGGWVPDRCFRSVPPADRAVLVILREFGFVLPKRSKLP